MCEHCKPWYNSKPLFYTETLSARLIIKDDMNWYVQVLAQGLWTKKWREVYLVPIEECPICGRDLRGYEE